MHLKRFDYDVLFFFNEKRALSERVAYPFDKRHFLRANEASQYYTFGSIKYNCVYIALSTYINHYSTINFIYLFY